MSLLQIYKTNFRVESKPIVLGRTAMQKKETLVNGVLVEDYEFVTLDPEKDSRNDVHYQDLCLGNLQQLGVLSKLERCMLQRDDVDSVISSIENLPKNEPTQTLPEGK